MNIWPAFIKHFTGFKRQVKQGKIQYSSKNIVDWLIVGQRDVKLKY